MSRYVPFDLNLDDNQTPTEILLEAKKEWTSESKGVLSLDLQGDTTDNGNSMVIVRLVNTASNASATLFSIVHRPEMPYPVMIMLEDDLPKFLKKTYYEPGSERIQYNSLSSLKNMLEPQVIRTEGRTVENEWVAETPTEFRSKLADAFSQGYIKALVINVASARRVE